MLNGTAMVERIVARHPEDTVLLVCSGSADNFNLEDFYGAGYLVSLLRAAPGEREFSDAALAAGFLHDTNTPQACLWNARVGRMMLARGLEKELHFAAQKSRFDVVPRLLGGALRASE
ncbi:MAG TPA: 2-phosphosulfolactate phosphatase [Burkholderiaceae bacterium]|nr:2-phosphosulfolactate phosphatase [Burkholderiaceae bacterium]